MVTLAVLSVSAAAAAGLLAATRGRGPAVPADRPAAVDYQPRRRLDTSGYRLVIPTVHWRDGATLPEVADAWRRAGYRAADGVDAGLAGNTDPGAEVFGLTNKALMLNSEGEARQAYDLLTRLRGRVAGRPELAGQALYTLINLQGVTALRRGENDNCVMCRGEGSCILPINPAAVHANPTGSRLAVGHFTEYLARFPDDREARWLLNLAHMTLGEHPHKVDPRYLLSLDHFVKSEFDIGRFRDVGHFVGVNRYNQSGGAILDDFDGDGLLDLVTTDNSPTESMAFLRNTGDGHFEDRTKAAGLADQLGGLVCVQGDYDNDGLLDVFVPRGAWLLHPVRPSLLRNLGGGRFADVTSEAGLLDPVNSNSAGWADYDNDGRLDLFVACERQANRLYHNRGDGTFEEVAAAAGVTGSPSAFYKGSAWLDYDDDGDPDLFLNSMNGSSRFYRNDGDGHFTDVTLSHGVDGPPRGFSCWSWDFDNDGRLDIYASGFNDQLEPVLEGLLGRPTSAPSNRLFRNVDGKGFQDVTAEAGLAATFDCMGSNFGDLDNDGFPDMYLATGAPSLAVLVPNRMFLNVGGARFAEVTGSSRTGHLQKGHAVAIGDWDRDGDLDLFIETGGAVNGDRYHDVLFQNPGQGRHWLAVKLVGVKTNRSALGARIKVVTAGPAPRTVYRHVTSGSSFGGNPLEQHAGLGDARAVATLEIHWPTSNTTQTFYDIAADQALEITEFADTYKVVTRKPVPLPAE